MGPSTSTSLTLRALLKTAAGRLGLGVPAPGISGLTPRGQGAVWPRPRRPARPPCWWRRPTPRSNKLASGCPLLLRGARRCHRTRKRRRAVLPFPSHEVDPYRGLAPHFDVASARARALYGLSTGTARLVVASAQALLPRLTPAARLRDAGLTVKSGDDISPVDLGDRLVEAGYTRQDPTDEPGEFSVRGGVVDVFPPGARQPVRLEFVGDTVESLRTYDPSSQRSTGGIDQVQIIPLAGAARSSVARRRVSASRARRSTGPRPSSTTSLSTDPSCSSLSPTKSARRSTSFARRSRRATAKPRARTAAWRHRTTLVIGWTEIAPSLEHATALETLDLDAAGGRHIASQPAMEFAGRVPDWVGELRQARERGETQIFVAHSQGRAERVIELLGATTKCPAAPIERGEDAPAASGARRRRPSLEGFSPSRGGAAALGGDRRVR